MPASLRTSALFPFQYDAMTEQVMMVALSGEAVANASFLDQRILSHAAGSSAVSIRDFEAAAETLPARLPNTIFHQGHCGSTLISRLIATMTSSRAVREPLVLRTLATVAAQAASGDAAVAPMAVARRLILFLRCFAQGATPSIVKASSICTDLAGPFLSADPNGRALFLYVRPAIYIATMLAGPNNRIDLTAFGGLRRQRLRNRGIDTAPLYQLAAGPLAALAWLCEAAAFHAAPDDGRFLAIEFDAFLSEPAAGLVAAARHLGLPAEAGPARAAVEGPDMRTYSKAQQHEYSPALRAEVIAQARREFAAEIQAGLDWLAETAARNDLARRAIQRLAD